MHMIMLKRSARALRRVIRDQRGLAMLEFAFSLPIVLGVGLYAVEISSLALANLRVSQLALTLADNASRVGVTPLNISQLREVDVNDIFEGAKKQSAGWQFAQNGRITLSSLEEKAGNQVAHWQRCYGLKSGTGYDSSYGTTTTTDGTDTTTANDGTIVAGGMGDVGAKVLAPPNGGVMFVEVNFDYSPIVSSQWLPGGVTKLHYIASYIVRDNRDFTQIYNPNPAAVRMTCNLYTS